MVHPLIRAILIDPYTQTVSEFDFVPSMENYYSIIGCQTVAAFDMDVATAWIDDEYNVSGKVNRAYWMLSHWFMPLGGRCILTARLLAPSGRTRSVPELLLRHVAPHVVWVEANEVSHVYG